MFVVDWHDLPLTGNNGKGRNCRGRLNLTIYSFLLPTGNVSLEEKVRVHSFSDLLCSRYADFVSPSLAMHEDENTIASRVISL